MKNWLRELRISHYVKNMIIILPVVFSGNLMQREYWMDIILGFCAFSAMASSIYIINDIHDCEKDKLHPVKKNRPIASGAIRVQQAYIMIGGLLVLTVLLGVVLSLHQNSITPVAIMGVYYFVNIGYSVFGWKNKAILDVIILAGGYYLRLLFGSAISEIQLSNWLSLVIIAGAFFMGFGKRRNEYKESENETRTVLKEYSYSYCNSCMYCCMTLVITFFSFWCLEKDSVGKNYILLIPLFLIWCLRYVYDLEVQSDGDPMSLLLHDKILISFSAFIGIVCMILIYI
ncbi:MAG: UbiA prenyltransferase family protein [Lachnospiraceae bacterium]|nr:UbiA prenyltransferase family protein [Lachnospiraceae bacterium]